MATALSNALPVTGADGSTGRNNGRDIRKGLLSSLLLPDTKANPLAVRNGVLSHDYDSGGVKSLRVDQTGTASAQVIIQPGAFVSERAGQGPYIGWLETSAGVLITPTTSDSTNPRIDVVYAQVLDKASISLDGSTDAIVDMVTGTPSATPQVPAVTADGAVILAQLYRPAGSSTITTANITDKRRSSGLVGTIRRMLPGDALSDAGKVDGEARYRQAVGGLPALLDYWDGAQGLWRGTQGFTLTGPWPTSNFGGITVSINNSVITYSSVSGLSNVPIAPYIPDPGWPYRVEASGTFYVQSVPGGASLNTYVSINGNFFAGSLSTAFSPQNMTIVPAGNTVYTGSSTARLYWDVLGFGGLTLQADVRNNLMIRVEPA